MLLGILAVAFLSALSQKIEENGKKWIKAIMFGKIDEVNQLIQAGVDVNKRFDLGASRDITPLYFAVSMGNADIGKLLIDAGANVDINFKGVNFLHIAGLYAGNKAVTELLIANGLDVNAKSMASGETKDATPLHAAAGKGNIEVAEVLKMYLRAFPDFNWDIQDIIVKGDKVIVRSIVTGTHKGDMQGIPATGIKVKFGCIVIYRLQEGKIVEEWAEFEMLNMLMQLGMELKPKEEK